MEIFEHLAVKLILNVLSTGVMARMGRIKGNYMIHLAMSNKKLVDRSARIVADVCNVPYETALEENFYSSLLCKAEGRNDSPAGKTIMRLSKKE
jgi:N-acetylmuramic acid 6-phosphate (MurNAc-6-P) etherase